MIALALLVLLWPATALAADDGGAALGGTIAAVVTAVGAVIVALVQTRRANVARAALPPAPAPPDGECVRCAVIAAERDAAHRRADDASASAERRHAEVVTISTTARDAMVSTAGQIERLVGAVGTLATEVRELAREQRR